MKVFIRSTLALLAGLFVITMIVEPLELVIVTMVVGERTTDPETYFGARNRFSELLSQLPRQRLTDLPSTLSIVEAPAVLVRLQLEWTDRRGPALLVDRHEGEEAGIGVPLPT